MANVTHDFPALSGAGADWRTKKDRVTIFDTLSEFADRVQSIPSYDREDYHNATTPWYGSMSYDGAIRCARNGDMTRVSASDEYLQMLEDKFKFSSAAFRNIDAMAGGVPNVPAFLASQPMAMRRRQRVQVELPPLNIVIDLASSGSVDANHLVKRGAALLALVRVLSAMRPVNLYIAVAARPNAGGSTGDYSSSAMAFRLDSSPLDVARAAHVLSEVAVARRLFYCGVTKQVGGRGGSLQWAYNNVTTYRRLGQEYWQRALGADELLFVAPAFATDKNIVAPEKWLAEMIEEYGFTDQD